MPYHWLPPTPDGVIELRLWPHRSLSRHGFVLFIGATSVLTAIPLVGLIGQKVLWGILPFLVIAVSGIWFALRKSERDLDILEVLKISDTNAILNRTGPHGRVQTWEANVHWVLPVLHPTGGPVLQYLTLRGGPREVELGSFLTPIERQALNSDLQRYLRKR